MYQQGHFAKVRRPTGPELYEDAAHILDELLQKQLNKQRRPHGQIPRYKTHPFGTHLPITAGEVLDERDEAGMEDGIERSKTMPSRMRNEPRDTDSLRMTDKNHLVAQVDLSASSADTEGDSSLVSENRKKKGFLRRAKDRLMHSFHRQEREKENRLKTKDSPKASPKKQARKESAKKPAEAEQNGIGKEDTPSPSQSGEVSGKRRNSVSKALQSIRKSFRSKKEDRHGQVDIGKRPSAASSSGTSRPSPDQDFTTPLPPPPAPPSSSRDRFTSGSSYGGGKPPIPAAGSSQGGDSLTVPPRIDHRKGSSHSAHEHSVSPYPHSTSTDSHLGNGEVTSSIHSFSSARHNALDNPAEDIEFMDIDSVGDGGARLAGRSTGEQRVNGRKYPLKHQSSLCIDGDSDHEDGKPSPPKSTEEVPLHERTSEEKEEMYGKIAQKLIHIADNFAAESGISDAEGHHREGGASAQPRPGPDGDGVLSDLERQILECLRAVGDRNSSVINGQAEELIKQTKAETYERFKSTMQQSLGNDLSWNHLAVLFYTTKGVVSAVGIGSKLANDAKEMTLHYISDRFAKWLMDRGGFDSVLSESDSELD